MLELLGGLALEGQETEGMTGADAMLELPHLGPQPGHGITRNGIEGGNVGRSRVPGQTGSGPGHGPLPADHGDDGELPTPAGSLGSLEHARALLGPEGDFPDGHPVNEGHAEGPDVAHPFLIHGGTGDLDPTQRIRPVQDHDLDTRLEAGLHGIPHAANVGIAAHPDVLQVDHQAIQAGQHLGGGLAEFSIEGVDGQAGAPVDFVVHRDGRLLVPVDPMLGPEEGDQFDRTGPKEYVDGAAAGAVLARRVGEQPDPLALENAETGVLDVVDPETNGGLSRKNGRGGGKDANKEREEELGWLLDEDRVHWRSVVGDL